MFCKPVGANASNHVGWFDGKKKKELLELIYEINSNCKIPGLGQSKDGTNTNPRQTVNHFLHCGLVREVEHDTHCEYKS